MHKCFIIVIDFLLCSRRSVISLPNVFNFQLDCQQQGEQSVVYSESSPELGVLTGQGGGRNTMGLGVRQTWVQILALAVNFWEEMTSFLS